MSDITTIIQPTIKSEPKVATTSNKDSSKSNFESSLKKAEDSYSTKEELSATDTDTEHSENAELVNNAQIESQSKLNENSNKTTSEESNIEKMLGEIINNQGSKSKVATDTKGTLAQTDLSKTVVTNNSQEPKTPESLLVQKIEQIINDQTKPQNISINSTTETAAKTTTTASTAGLINTKDTLPNQLNTEESKIRSKVEGKVQDDTVSNFFKNSKTDSNAEKISEIKSSNGQLSQPQTSSLFNNMTGDGQASPEISTIFGQVLTSSASTITSQGTIQGQTVNILPSGNIVYDDKVINQINDQFKINGTETQQKINIRLNPVELGELKIEMTMKEDSVKVNVVTQSQQAQEILERNMPKLKAILEEKGLTIEDIMVSQETKTLSEFQLSEQDMGQNQSKQHSSGDDSNYAFSAQFNESIQDITNQTDGISVTI